MMEFKEIVQSLELAHKSLQKKEYKSGTTQIGILLGILERQVKNIGFEPPVSGSLFCPNCKSELKIEVKEITNSDILKAVKNNDR